MKREHTTRLFYGRYPYRILFHKAGNPIDPAFNDGWTVHKCKAWLDDNGLDYRMYNRVHDKRRYRAKNQYMVVSGSLFLKDKTTFDQCIARWKDSIDTVTSPYDDSHVDILAKNTSISIRARLLYKRYRYVITFRFAYKETTDDLINWVNNNFLSKANSADSVKFIQSSWRPRLYLRDEDDFVLVKMIWSDRIRDIVVVYTHDDLEGVTS